jgi:hypothetical protein
MPLVIDSDDIWVYIYQKKEASYSDLIDAFVGKQKCAKGTFLKYKRLLEDQKKIEKKIGPDKDRRIVYYVPEGFRQEVAILAEKREFKEQIDKMSPREISKMKKEFLKEFFE